MVVVKLRMFLPSFSVFLFFTIGFQEMSERAKGEFRYQLGDLYFVLKAMDVIHIIQDDNKNSFQLCDIPLRQLEE